MFEEGLRLFQYGRFEQCLSVLGVVLSSDPDHQDALRLSASCLLLLGRPREAIAPLRRAARHVSAPVETLLSLAQAFEALDRPVAAQLALRRAVREHPASLMAREEHARVLVRLGRGVAAEVEARRALHDADGRSDSALLSLGCALFQQRRMAEAVDVLGPLAFKGGKRPPASLSALVVLGRARQRLGDREAAAKILTMAANRMPDDARLNVRAARLQIAMGNPRIATQLLRQAETAAGAQPGLLLAVAGQYLAAGAAAPALRAARTAADLPQAKKSHALNLTLALCHQAEGDDEAAERHLTYALHSHPTSLPARLARAEGRLRLDQPAKARSDLETLLAAHPDHAQARLLMGETLFRLNMFTPALPYLSDALKDDTPAAAAFLLGQALYRSGRAAEAVEAMEAAQRRDPTLPDIALWVRRARNAAGRGEDGANPFAFLHGKDYVAQTPSFLSSLYRHVVVVNALMQRQARVKFGARKLGYLMAIIPPMIGLALMMFIMTVIRNRQPGDMPLALFLMTGLVAWHFFNAVWISIEKASKVSQGVLAFSSVRPLDVRVALCLFDLVTQCITLAIFSVILLYLDFELYVDKPLQVIAGVGVLILLAVGIGMIMEVAISFWRTTLSLLSGVISRALFLTSGIFFSAHDLPPEVREYALYNPLLHVIEYIRNGAEASFPLIDANIEYPIAVGSVMLLMGLVLESRHRARLLRQ
ncbi:tetratricopeptide repeat protein [Novispirillum sp. DQ9]|uniref:tetratricopeptide repeat protein n=1 Tax=Novispirillum sp. DQ9 TaxID=3398612 RepID=UPI003C7DB32C